MKYYTLTNSTNLKEIGYFIQTIGSIDANGQDVKGINSRVKLNQFTFPSFVPDLRFKLENKAILTDVISTSNIHAKGFLISNGFKNLLFDFNIIEHKFYPSSVIANNISYDYYWLHLVKNNFNGIDFSNSTFYNTAIFGSRLTRITISSYDDYIEQCKRISNLNRIVVTKLVLTESFLSMNYDLFFFPYIHDFVIASEELISTIKKHKISGLTWEVTDF
ncbi:MAG: hypothetical protein WAQ28_10485 [Bacteroidia bacterium]